MHMCVYIYIYIYIHTHSVGSRRRQFAATRWVGLESVGQTNTNRSY